MTQTETASDLAPNRAPDERIICALDVPTTVEAAALVQRVQDAVGFYKTGCSCSRRAAWTWRAI